METENQELQDQLRNQEDSGEINETASTDVNDPTLQADQQEIKGVEPEEILHEIEQLRQQVEHYKSQAEQAHEQHLRSLADLENFRRRARKEKEDAVKYAALPLVESLLPVLDNFERALEAADHNNDSQVLKEGVEMVYRQFLTVLSQAGVTLIESEGKMFDPHEHNAVMQVESDQIQPGMVVEELQAGYRFHDRVIRPSMVKIST